jgi:hypothetical protein
MSGAGREGSLPLDTHGRPASPGANHATVSVQAQGNLPKDPLVLRTIVREAGQ